MVRRLITATVLLLVMVAAAALDAPAVLLRGANANKGDGKAPYRVNGNEGAGNVTVQLTANAKMRDGKCHWYVIVIALTVCGRAADQFEF